LKLNEFIKKACVHRIKVRRNGFFVGILLMIGSWQLIAYGINTHVILMNSWLASFFDFSVQMFLATFLLFLISIITGLTKNQGFKGYLILKISKRNDVINKNQVRQLSYAERICAIYARAVLATSGYFLFELARVFIGVIDNSTLHGADALMYALMFGWWIEKKSRETPVYTRSQWIGIAISASAIIFAFIYESITKNPLLALGGAAEGVGSAIMLSSVILISSIVVYHDSVIRIAFHNCLFGFVASFVVVLFTIHFSYNGDFTKISALIKQLDVKSIVLVSASYAIALLGFLQSYKYIEPVLIAMLGNSLGIGTILMSAFLIEKNLNFKNIFITVLLCTGSIILCIHEWKKDRELNANKTFK
jgi:hypothetical protein